MSKFPEIFTNKDFQYGKSENDKNKACADGLDGWAICMKGNPPPETFGIGMAKIGTLLGIKPSADELSIYANKILNRE